MDTFRNMRSEDRKRLVEKFGLFGSKRRYTATTYFSNRLDAYSQKPCSILVPFTGYKKGKFKDYKKTTRKKGFRKPLYSCTQKEVRIKALNEVSLLVEM